MVRQSQDREAHLGLYEEDLPEHTMVVHDWLVELTVNRFAHHHHAGGDNKPKSMLINGRREESYPDISFFTLLIFLKNYMSMTKKCHNFKLQTNTLQ